MMILRTGVASILVLAFDIVRESSSMMMSFTDGVRSFRARRPVALHASSSAEPGLLNV